MGATVRKISDKKLKNSKEELKNSEEKLKNSEEKLKNYEREKFEKDFAYLFSEYNECRWELFGSYTEWISKRDKVIRVLSEIAEDIQKHHSNVNIASISGSSISLAGGLLCIAGFACAPFTGGLSLALTAGGFLGSAAGTLTAAGSYLADIGIKAVKVKEAQNLIEEDRSATLNLDRAIDKCQKSVAEIITFLQKRKFNVFINDKNILKFIPQSFENTGILKQFYKEDVKNLGTNMRSNMANNFASATRSASTSANGVRSFAQIIRSQEAGTLAVGKITAQTSSHVFLGFAVIFDIFNIGFTAKKIHCKEKSEICIALEEIVSKLLEQKLGVMNYFCSNEKLFSFPKLISSRYISVLKSEN